MDIVSYLLGKKAGGGSSPNLQSKEITITENGTQNVSPDTGYDGLLNVEITTDVSSGEDWSDIGYSAVPDAISLIHAFSKEIYDNWNPDSPYRFNNQPYNYKMVICPLVDVRKLAMANQCFDSCVALKEVPALNFTNIITNCNKMFYQCKALEKVDLSNMDTSNVTNFQQMFQSCWSLKNLDVTHLNTEKGRYFNNMFAECKNLESLDLSNFNTGVTSLSKEFNAMFSGCENLKSINFGNNFDTSLASRMEYMFYNCTKLDDNTLNQILQLCINATSLSASDKKLSYLSITDATLLAKVPTLSNYQAFIDAGWTIN